MILEVIRCLIHNGCETSDTLMVQFGQAIPQLNIEELVRCNFDAILEVESFGMEEGWGFVDELCSSCFH